MSDNGMTEEAAVENGGTTDEASASSPSASEVQYEAAIEKARRLEEKFSADNVWQSPYTEDKWLGHYGWQAQTLANRPPSPQDRPKLAMYDDLDLSTHTHDNIVTDVRQSRSVHAFVNIIEQGQKAYYDATDARFTLLNTPGAILAHYSKSPTWLAEKDNLDPDSIVPLCYWSNIAFLIWQAFCASHGHPIHDLRYILCMNVANTPAKNDTLEVLRRAGLQVREWPWREVTDHTDEGAARFEAGSEWFHAILGKPNGIGAAQLLLQHREQMHGRRITTVSVFKTNSATKEWPFSLCFHVGKMAEQDEQA